MKQIKLKIVISSFVLLLCFVFSTRTSLAQALDPSSWQSGATGLSTQLRTDKKTAGLGLIVEQRTWPFLYAMGGVKMAGGKLGESFTGIELGQIEAGGAGGFVSEETDWAHNTLTFNGLKLYTSRLSPAVVIESPASSIQLFTGTVNGLRYTSPTSVSAISRISSPKYVAYPAGSSASVEPLSASATSLSPPNWLLVWYGDNSHFIDSKVPSTYGANNAILPVTEGYQADVPILLTFENNPTSVKQGTNGGIELSFPGASGHITVLPLFGREILKTTETEGWASGLPQNVLTKITFWKDRLCQFPYKVTEDYAYDAGTDATAITEDVNFLQTCTSSTTKFAPVSPLLAIAKDALPITFSQNLTDADLATEFGPLLGIDNPSNNRYTWSLSGLNKYITAKRQPTTGQAPVELVTELESEVQKIVSAGHLAPWIFIDMIKDTRGDIYWANPADSIYQLIEIAEALPAGQNKTDIVNYIKAERNTVAPENVYHLDYAFNETAETISCTPACASRGEYKFYGSPVSYAWNNPNHKNSRSFYKKVPLYNFYALSRYYELTQESVPSDVITKAKDVLSTDMRNHDWATMYWFDGYDQFYGHPDAVAITNRYFAGLIGFNRLVAGGDTQETKNIARGLLAKAAVLRVAMAKYPRYLDERGLITLPADPAWQVKYIFGDDAGELYNYSWTGPYDDPRQLHTLSQFDVFLKERYFLSYGNVPADWKAGNRTYLIGLRGITPELARLLTDSAKTDIDVYINKYVTLFPHWYAVFMDGQLGHEHGQNHPVDPYQIFLGKAWIQRESANNLRKYRDISQLTNGGDFFYVHKLAETIKAYRGWEWSDQGQPTGVPSPTPTHCTPLGDINCSGKVDILDLSALLSKFGSTDAKSDLNNSGKVDILDLSILLSNFGK